MKTVYLFVLMILCLCSVGNVAAAEGIGGVAGNILQPVSVFSQFLSTACFIIGGAFLFAALIKYFEHKRSPLMTPMSTVVFLVIAGIVLILLPFLSLISQSIG